MGTRPCEPRARHATHTTPSPPPHNPVQPHATPRHATPWHRQHDNRQDEDGYRTTEQPYYLNTAHLMPPCGLMGYGSTRPPCPPPQLPPPAPRSARLYSDSLMAAAMGRRTASELRRELGLEPPALDTLRAHRCGHTFTVTQVQSHMYGHTFTATHLRSHIVVRDLCWTPCGHTGEGTHWTLTFAGDVRWA